MMNFKINNIIQNGKIGTIDLEIEGKNFFWKWEFCVGEYVAIISVPDQNEWNSIFVNSQIKREEYLSEIAKEIIKLKCKGCSFEITKNEIAILGGHS